jgi:hypothetical protein
MNSQYLPAHLREPIPRVRCLPGINPDEPYIYKTVFFGAEREYADNEGWTKVVRGRRQQRRRKVRVVDEE